MVEHDALLGGESSGGLTVRGHILGKDGIFACALVVEMLARTGKKISEMQEEVWKISGRLFSLEENIPATPEMRVAIPQAIEGFPHNQHWELSSPEHFPLRRDEIPAGKRQLGAAALLRHRTGAAPDG